MSTAPFGLEDQGPDDFIAHAGPEAFAGLVEKAVPFSAVKRIRARLEGSSDAAEILDDKVLMLLIAEESDSVREKARRALKDAGLGDRVVTEALKSARQSHSAEYKTGNRSVREGTPFHAEGGVLYERVVRNKQVTLEVLALFDMRFARETVLKRGNSPELIETVVVVELPSGEKREFTVPSCCRYTYLMPSRAA